MSSSEDSLKSLSLDYLNLLINGQAFSDVAFSVEGRLVHAHRCVLAARSLFFRKLFCGLDPNHQPPPPPPPLNWPTAAGSGGGGARGGGGAGGAPATPELVIPVSSIRYEVLVLVLQFLYSGQASVAAPKSGPLPGCGARGCWHTRCGAAVDLALDTLAAARSFGVEQLALLVQKQLESMVKEASVDDVMKVLMASRKFEMQELWATCSHLVARSGLSADLLAKHLPIDVVAKIEEIRAKSPLTATATTPRSPFLTHHYLPINAASSAADRDNKIRRMRRALDAADIELVKLMVMGEGLDLDDALAVHYAVQHCNRDVVKALLELGAADVNSRAGPTGKTALHLAAEMVSPDMVSVLLDHHADPNARTLDGVTPLDVLRSLTSEFLFKGAVPGLTHIEPNKLRLCLELVQSAVMVTTRDEGAPGGGGGEAGGSDDANNFPRSDADDSLVSLTMNSTLMYQGQEMAAAVAAGEARKGNNGRASPSALYFPNGFP